MEQIKRRGLGANGWQAILERFAGSELTVQAFCKREGVSVASFYHWRAKLAGSKSRLQPMRATQWRQPRVDFVDLGTLGTREARVSSGIEPRGFELRLDLGGGVQLHLVRG